MANHSLHSGCPCSSGAIRSKKSLARSGRRVCAQLTTYSLSRPCSRREAACCCCGWACSRREKQDLDRCDHRSLRPCRSYVLI